LALELLTLKRLSSDQIRPRIHTADKIDFGFVADTIDPIDFDKIDRVEVDFGAHVYAARVKM